MKLSVHLFLTDILPGKRRFFNKVVKNKIFGKLPPDQVFPQMKAAGINGVEVLIPNFVNSDDINELKRAADENKMKIYSIHQALRFVTKTSITEIIRLFKIAKHLGAKVIVLHMNSAKKQVFNRKYIEALHMLQKEYGIKVGFENMERHAGSILNKAVWHETEFVKVMKQNDFQITLDVCHLGQSGGDIIKFVNDNSERIVNIHLSDYKKHYLNNSLRPMRYKHMQLGKGQLPIKEFLKTLKNKKYKGLITLEIETNLDGLLESARIVNDSS